MNNLPGYPSRVPVEFILEADVKAVQPNQVEYLRHGQTETLIANTIVWTTGADVNPLIKQLPVKIENRDKRGKLHVNSYLQLPEYSEVFAGGDCVICPCKLKYLALISKLNLK